MENVFDDNSKILLKSLFAQTAKILEFLVTSRNPLVHDPFRPGQDWTRRVQHIWFGESGFLHVVPKQGIASRRENRDIEVSENRGASRDGLNQLKER